MITPSAAEAIEPVTYRGHLLWGALMEMRDDPLAFMQRMADLGDIVRLRVGPYASYLIAHPDYVQHVVQRNDRNYRRHPALNRILRQVSGVNLFTSDGESWLARRRLMQPAFHRKSVHGFGERIVAATESMLGPFERAAGGGAPVDVSDIMMTLTTEVVGQTLCSVSFHGTGKELGDGLITATEYVQHRYMHPIDLPLMVPTRWHRRFSSAMANTRRILQTLIDQRRRGEGDASDLLSMMMAAQDADTGERMTDQQLQNELVMLFGGGQQNTANLMTWSLYRLATEPEVTERLLAELEDVVGDRRIQSDDLPDLPYQKRFFCEVLRLHPPAFVFGARQPIEDDQVGPYRIARGANVMINPYSIHRDPRFWEQPERFDPDRFCAERAAGRHPFAFVPFSAGPRGCIGDNLAMAETQMVISTLLRRYRLELPQGSVARPQAVFSLGIRGGLPMYVHRRSPGRLDAGDRAASGALHSAR